MGQQIASLEIELAMATGNAVAAVQNYAKVVGVSMDQALRDLSKIDAATQNLGDLSKATAAVASFGKDFSASATGVSGSAVAATRDLNRLEKQGEALISKMLAQANAIGKSKEELQDARVEALALTAAETGLTDVSDRLLAASRQLQAEKQALAEGALERQTLAEAQAAQTLADSQRAVIVQLQERAQLEAAIQRNTGVGQTRATDAGATYSALAAQAAEEEAQAYRDAAAAYAMFQARAQQGLATWKAEQAAAEADATAMDRLRAMLDPTAAAQQRLGAEIEEARRVMTAAGASAEELARVEQMLKSRFQETGGASGASHAAIQNFGFQVQDFAVQIVGGTDVLRVFAQQFPQAAGAMSGMEGKLGAIGAFLNGPFGIALTLGITLLAGFADKLFQSDDAAKKAEEGLKTFQNRQSEIGSFIDATTGRLREQNAELIRNGVLTRQRQIDANAQAIKDQTEGAFRQAQNVAARTITVGLAPTRIIDPDVQKVLAQANGDIAKLDAGLQALSARRPDLKSTIQAMSDAAAGTVNLTRENQRLGQEVDLLTGKTTRSSSAIVERQVALSTSTDAVSKAQAHLDDVRAQGHALDTQFFATEQARTSAFAKYRADLTAATNALHGAQEARKADTAAQRDANKEANHAADLARDASAIESQIRNLGLLASAYGTSGAAALIAEARERAEATAIKQRGDVDAAVERQIRLTIAQRIADGARSTASMRDQAAAQEQVNAQVEAGLVPASKAAEMVRDQLADLPLLQAIQAAQQSGLTAEADRATKALDDQRAARTSLNAAEKAAQDLQQSDQIRKETDLNEQLAAVTEELGEKRLAALRGLSGQPLEDALAAINVQQEKSNILLRAQAAAADLVSKGMTSAAAATLAQAQAAADAAERQAAQQKAEDTIARHKQEFLDVAQQFADVVGGGLGRAVSEVLPMLDKAQAAFSGASTLAKLAAGAGIGGSVAGSLGLSSIGGSAGGALGGVIGKNVLSGALSSISSSLKQFAGPIGSVAGGLLGGIIGGLFSKVKKASATIEVIAGDAVTASITGNSSKLKAVAGTLADSLISGLTDIAGQLGGDLSDNLKVSIGQRKKTYRVDLSGQGRTKNMPSFDTQEEAVAYAVQSVIQQGAITGLRAGTETLLEGKGDLQTQLQKALSFEDVFDQLKQATDPVGYAMDQIAKQFDQLNDVFKEAGASADDYAALQQLRTIKETEAQAQAQQAVQDDSERLGLERQLLEAQGDTAGIRKMELDALLPANRALQEQIYALQDEAAAAQAAAAIEQERAGLEEQLLQLQGDTVALRQRELDALDPSNRALQEQIYALQDQQAATEAATQAAEAAAQAQTAIDQERAGIQSQIWQLEGDTASIRAAELATLDESNRALQERLYALQDEQAATEAASQAAAEAAQKQEAIAQERQGLMQQLYQLQGNTAALRKMELAGLDASNRALQQQIYNLQDAQDAAEKAKNLADAWQSVGDTIMDEIKRIRGLTDAGSGNGYAQLLGQFNAATAAARGGDQDAAKSLPDLSKSLLDAASAAATSRQELARIEAQTASSLQQTYDLITAATGASGAATGTLSGASSGTTSADAASWWATFAASQDGASISSANDDLIEEVQNLRAEVAGLRADQRTANAQLAAPLNKVAKKFDDVTKRSGGDRIAVYADAKEPLPTKAVA